ncbi:hypothetical protein SVIOM74S_06258 [Streptomyces violarus]
MFVFFVLYQLSNPFAGEANYKVWSQLTLPADTRGTTQGLAYALARGVFAVAAFFTPALADYSPAVLLWTITACMTAAAFAGGIIRVLGPRVPPARRRTERTCESQHLSRSTPTRSTDHGNNRGPHPPDGPPPCTICSRRSPGAAPGSDWSPADSARTGRSSPVSSRS